jgi:iron-sulfur cluster insertion protein
MTVQSELSIGFSEAAARKAKLLIDEEANEALSLRVFVTGGGCSGLSMGLPLMKI